MQYELPHDPDGSWRASLTGWQLSALKQIARGKYARWSGQDRLVVKVAEHGFDVIGLRRAMVMDREGNEIPDAWVVAWVNEHHPSRVYYGSAPRAGLRRPEYKGHEEWGMKMWRTVRRRARRHRAREARKEARRLAELKAYEDGLTQHIKEGLSPLTYHPEDHTA